jgi:hypothetical protein
MRKLRSPHFVSAELLKTGEARLVDDDGEIYLVEMRRDMEWPLLSRQVRKSDMRRTAEAMRKRAEPPAPTGPFKPRLIS